MFKFKSRSTLSQLISTTNKNFDVVDALLALNGNIVLISEIPAELFKQIQKKKTKLNSYDNDLILMDIDYDNLYLYDD